MERSAERLFEPRAMTSEPRMGRDALGGPRRNAEAGLSIVVPVFNEAGGLGALHARVAEAARQLRAARGLTSGGGYVGGSLRAPRGLKCEVVSVDDGSRDDTLKVAQGLPATCLDIQVVSLSRNFGK